MNKYKSEKYINQRQLKGGWTFQVIIRKDNYKIIESFKESDYGSSRLAFDSAVRYRDKKLLEINNRTLFPGRSVTLGELFEMMHADSVDSNETKRKELVNFNKRIPGHDMLFEDITPAFIQSSLNKCIDDSDDVISRVISLWRKIYNYALLHEFIGVDYTRMVKIPRSRKITKKRPVLYEGEVDINALNRITDVYNRNLLKYAIQIAMYTGARPGEVFALCKSDIFEDRISINKELGNNRNTPILRPCKTPESVRVVPISTKLKPVLDELLAFTKNEQIFLMDNGIIMNSQWAGQRFSHYIKGFNMYMLRHRASTIWDNNNVSLRTIDELMGHKSSSMSTSYARSNWDLKVEAINLL